ncbi:hypothetical protein FOL47_005874, partial [Perkinsus chesapeaki]
PIRIDKVEGKSNITLTGGIKCAPDQLVLYKEPTTNLPLDDTCEEENDFSALEQVDVDQLKVGDFVVYKNAHCDYLFDIGQVKCVLPHEGAVTVDMYMVDHDDRWHGAGRRLQVPVGLLLCLVTMTVQGKLSRRSKTDLRDL